MRAELPLTVILKTEAPCEGLGRTLDALYAGAERPFELRAVAGKDDCVSPHVFSVYRKTKEHFSFTVQKNASAEEALAREIGKAEGKYILTADGGETFSPEGFRALTEYLSVSDEDAVFFGALSRGARFFPARAKGAGFACTVDETLSRNRNKFLPGRAVFQKNFLEKAVPYTGRLGYKDAFFTAPLMFCQTAGYVRADVCGGGKKRPARADAPLSDYIADAFALLSYFGETRPALSEAKYSYLFRYTEKRILRVYDAYLLSGGEEREEIRKFDGALREKNLPLYITAGERSVFSYVDALRKTDFALTRLQKTAVKLCIEVHNDFY